MATYDGTPNDDILTGDITNDILNGLAGNDQLYGLDGDDTLNGGDGDDTLYGGEGVNLLDGGLGNDLLTDNTSTGPGTMLGGDGDDTMGAYAANETFDGGNGRDVLDGGFHQDFSTATISNVEVLITYGNSITATAAQLDGFETITVLDNPVFDTTQVSLQLSGSGTVDLSSQLGARAAYVYASSSGNGITTSTGDDFLQGGSGDDTLNGGAGNDIIYGNDGNDQLSGADGDDTLYGGEGVNLLDGGLGNDLLTDNTSTGPGTILGGDGDDTLAAYMAGETVDGGAGRDVMQAANADISGMTISNVEVLETQGSTITGTAAQFAAFSTITYLDQPGYDTVPVGLQLSGAGTVDLSGALGAQSTYLTTSSAGNSITTGAGDDTLTGDVGDDTLAGGAGNDYLYSLEGNDQLSGGAGNDTLFGGVGVNLLDGGLGNDLLINDSSTASGTILGGDGNDTIQAWAANDTVDGGNGRDVLTSVGNISGMTISGVEVLETQGGPVIGTAAQFSAFSTINYLDQPGYDTTPISLQLAGSGTVDLSGQLGARAAYVYASSAGNGITTSSGDDYLQGDVGDDTLSGGGGADYLSGGGGVNRLDGGDGNDTLYASDQGDTLLGGNNDDQLYSGLGADSLDGGAGSDTAYLSGNHTDFTFAGNAASFTATDISGGAGVDTLTGIEFIQFSDGLYSVASLGIGGNNPPTLSGPAVLTASPEDQPRTITLAELLAGASDPDPADSLSVVNLTVSSGGLVDNGNGTWTFTPAANDDTGVTFSYEVTDGTATVAQTASMDLTPVNDAPTTSGPVIGAATEDGPAVTLDALQNASDPDGDALTIVNLPVSLPPGVTVNMNGHPFALGDIHSLSIPANSNDANSHALNDQVWSVTAPPGGTINTTSGIGWLVNPDYQSDVAANYFTMHDHVPSFGQYPDPARTIVTFQFAAPTAVDAIDLIEHRNGITSLHVYAGNDLNALTDMGSTIGSLGDLSGFNTMYDGQVDSFDIQDTAPITYLQVVLDKRAAPDGYALYRMFLHGTSAAGPSLTFDPSDPAYQYLAAGEQTTVTVNYGVSDGALTTPASMSWVVTGVNDAPVVASPAALAASAEDAVRIITTAELLAGASDVDTSNVLSVVNLTVSSGGLVDNGNGTWTFTPAANDDTGVTFSYGVTDGTATVAQTASMDLSPVNDAPVGTPDTAATAFNTALTLTAAALLGNDSDVDTPAAALTIGAVQNGTGGSVVLNADGTVTFTPAAGFSGTATFTYQPSDGALLGAATLVSVSVAPGVGGQVLTGNSSANNLTGGAGDDTISGLSGNDTLTGNDGNDVLTGGPGNDVLSGSNGDDTFLYGAGSNGFDQVDGGAGTDTIRATANGATIGLAALSGIEAISGGGFAGVRVVGSQAADHFDFTAVTLSGIAAIDLGSGNDTLAGSAGADTIIGGSGNDQLAGGGGDDTFLYGAGSNAYDQVDGGAGSNDRILATANNATIGLTALTGIEAIDAGGFTGVRVAGSSAADALDFTGVTLSGIAAIDMGGGNDTVTGSAGADTIIGGSGNDNLSGADGDDLFLIGVGAGTDRFDGGLGTDAIRASAANVTLNVTGTNLTGIEAISSGGFAGFRLLGTTGSDSLDFSGVTLTGVTVIGGGNGSDTITGSAGADTIEGGGGADLLTGGAGADVFLFSQTGHSKTAATADVIADFAQGQDMIDLRPIDANVKVAGNDAFSFIGAAAFSGVAGQLRFDTASVPGMTRVLVDVDGNKVADMEIDLTGTHTLTAGDFLL
ncbi:MAG: cadherin-like domain-containing protein [Paracoccaceae bacterium]